MSLVKNIVEYSLFASVIILSLIFYLLISPFWGIITLLSGSIFIGLYLFLTIPGMLADVKYLKLVRKLKMVPMMTEEQLLQNSSLSANYIHKGMYELSKTWTVSPLMILVKKQYFYLDQTRSNQLIEEIQAIENQPRFDRAAFVSKVGQKYNFPSRAHTETTIQHLMVQLEQIPK